MILILIYTTMLFIFVLSILYNNNKFFKMKKIETKNVFESDNGEVAEQYIDAFMDEEKTKEEVLEEVKKENKEVQNIVNSFFS